MTGEELFNFLNSLTYKERSGVVQFFYVLTVYDSEIEDGGQDFNTFDAVTRAEMKGEVIVLS